MNENVIPLWRVKRITGLGEQTIFSRIVDGTFPRAYQFGRRFCWYELDVLDWISRQKRKA